MQRGKWLRLWLLLRLLLLEQVPFVLELLVFRCRRVKDNWNWNLLCRRHQQGHIKSKLHCASALLEKAKFKQGKRAPGMPKCNLLASSHISVMFMEFHGKIAIEAFRRLINETVCHLFQQSQSAHFRQVLKINLNFLMLFVSYMKWFCEFC